MRQTFSNAYRLLFAALSCVVLATASTTLNAQTYATNPYPKTITVTGSAEMEVVPDEVFVAFTIREYAKKGEGKMNIDTLKSQFLRACKKVGIADSNINITGYGGYNPLRARRRNPDLMASITYQVKFSSAAVLDQLSALLDDEATGSYSITHTRHSKASQFRRELKINALKAAKEKAVYLATSIGEEVGTAVTIEEEDTESNGSSLYNSNVSQRSSNTSYNWTPTPEIEKDEIAFRKIRYRYTMKAVFAIK